MSCSKRPVPMGGHEKASHLVRLFRSAQVEAARGVSGWCFFSFQLGTRQAFGPWVGGERTVLPHAVVPRPLVERIEAVLAEVHHRHLGPVRPGGRRATVGCRIGQQRLLDFLLPEELLGRPVGRAAQRPDHDGVVVVARKPADEEVEAEQEARHWGRQNSFRFLRARAAQPQMESFDDTEGGKNGLPFAVQNSTLSASPPADRTPRPPPRPARVERVRETMKI